MPNIFAIILVYLLTAMASEVRAGDALSQFRSIERGAAFDIFLTEKERFPRYSTFSVSAPISDPEKAKFLICSLAEFVSERGFTHLAIIGPSADSDLYVAGLFSSEEDDITVAFGNDRDLRELISRRPGAAVKTKEICRAKSQ
jgi:hypothetical protein